MIPCKCKRIRGRISLRGESCGIWPVHYGQQMNDAANWAIMTGLAQNENVNGRGLIQTLYSNLNAKCAVFAGTICRDILPDIYIGPRQFILVLLLIRVKPV